MKPETIFFGSNRTFMELKYESGETLCNLDSVLIVPLWN